MSVNFPQTELPRGIRGGSDMWDQPQASVVLLEDFFEQETEEEEETDTPTPVWRAGPLMVGRLL